VKHRQLESPICPFHRPWLRFFGIGQAGYGFFEQFREPFSRFGGALDFLSSSSIPALIEEPIISGSKDVPAVGRKANSMNELRGGLKAADLFSGSGFP